jgi:hypothetical protein
MIPDGFSAKHRKGALPIHTGELCPIPNSSVIIVVLIMPDKGNVIY